MGEVDPTDHNTCFPIHIQEHNGERNYKNR